MRRGTAEPAIMYGEHRVVQVVFGPYERAISL